MSMPRFEPGSFMTERELSTNSTINHWQNKNFFKLLVKNYKKQSKEKLVVEFDSEQ
jgi:hypothetical protein